MEKLEEDEMLGYMEKAKSILRQEKPESILKNALGLYKEEFLKNGIAKEVDGDMEFIAGTPFKASLDSLVEKISEVFPEKRKESELFKKVVKLTQNPRLEIFQDGAKEVKLFTFYMEEDCFQVMRAILRKSTDYVFEDFIYSDENYKFYYDAEKDKVVYGNTDLEGILVAMFGKENVERFSMELVKKRH